MQEGSKISQQQKRKKTTMTKNVIAYFSRITEPKVKIFEEESISIQFLEQLSQQLAYKIDQNRRMIHQKLVHDFRGGSHFLETNISWKI